MRAWLLVLAACGGAQPSPPSNRGPAAAHVTVAPGAALGWLALGPAAEAGSWLPVATLDGLTLTDDPLPPRVTAIDAAGAVAQLAVGASVPIEYGCDNNQLGVHPLTGNRLAPGPAWLLPPDAPADWHPSAVPIHRTQATPAQRTHAAGGLVITATRRGPAAATLTIDRDGRRVYSAVHERPEMDGAPSDPLDLTASVPGVPEPLAVWSIAPAGPLLVVLLVPGYEGVSLTTLLVDDTRARPVDGMELYLYACAF